eukprot:s444_g45.t1
MGGHRRLNSSIQILELSLTHMRAVATAQPKASKIPPIVREHKKVLILRGPPKSFNSCPVEPMQRLKAVWEVPKEIQSPVRTLPEGAQFLRSTPLRSNGGLLSNDLLADGVISVEGQSSSQLVEQAWGIPFSPDEFVAEAVARGHPKSFTKLVPSILRSAIINNFSEPDVSELPRRRAEWFARWTKRAKELVPLERGLKSGLPDHAAKILEPKRLLLWKEILRDLNYPDVDVFDEMLSGTELVGEVPLCGVFEKTFKHADMTAEQLINLGAGAKRKQFYSCCSSGDKEVDEQVLAKTREEVEAGWASGPWRLEDLPSNAVISRRFGLRQPGKIRLIDDLSGSLVNSTAQASESLKPQNADFIGAMLLEVLQHNANLVDVLGRTYDLKSAYKQMSIAPGSLSFAYVVIFNPETRKPEVYQLLAAPFGEQMKLLGSSQKKTIIFEAELLALILAFALWKDALQTKSIICFVDNNSARDVAISGCGRNTVAKALIEFLLKLEMATSTTPWYGRVPTPSNVADDPSRGCYQHLLDSGALRVDPTVELSQILEVLNEFSDMLGL